MGDCLFCRIVRGEIPAERVYEDDMVLAFEDMTPQAPVHVLVIPKTHHESLGSLYRQPALSAALVDACVVLAQHYQVTDSGFRVVTNSGKDGGQSVFHVHFHLLGGRPMTWPPG
ncbi:histidine triad nucleotide-binding protein [bacterium]|nr:histidine triad nucleotide-binding protein [bacterium]